MKLKQLFLAIVLLISTAHATQSTVQNSTNIKKNGKPNLSLLPFAYYRSDARNPRFDYVDAGYYKVCNLKKRKRKDIVIGPASPCLVIAITDGDTLMAFHKHLVNSNASLVDAVKKHLNLSDPQKLYARLYSVDDPITWQQDKCCENDAGGNSHKETIKATLAVLEKECAVSRTKLLVNHFPICTKKNDSWEYIVDWKKELGEYESATHFVAIKPSELFDSSKTPPQIQFFSISLRENFFNIGCVHCAESNEPIPYVDLSLQKKTEVLSEEIDRLDKRWETQYKKILGEARPHYNMLPLFNLESEKEMADNKQGIETLGPVKDPNNI